MSKKVTEPDNGQSAKRSGILTNPIRNLIVTAILCLALGVAFLALPYFVRDFSGYVIGGLACVIGLAYIVIYFLRKPVSGIYRSEFAAGVVMLAAGVYIIVASLRPDATGISITLRLIVTALGVLMAVDGVLKLQYTLDLARMQFDAWWLGLFTSLLGLAIGILTAAGLVDDLGVRLSIGDGDFLSAMLILGVAFIVNAVLDAVTVTLIAVRNHTAAKRAAADATSTASVPPAAGDYYAPTAPVPPVAPAPPAPSADGQQPSDHVG